jgi:hypothetical protein
LRRWRRDIGWLRRLRHIGLRHDDDNLRLLLGCRCRAEKRAQDGLLALFPERRAEQIEL